MAETTSVSFSFGGPVMDTAVQDGFRCAQCDICPIIGIRFKCTVRENFYLCSSCESKEIQSHSMMKFYDQIAATTTTAMAAAALVVVPSDVPGFPMTPEQSAQMMGIAPPTADTAATAIPGVPMIPASSVVSVIPTGPTTIPQQQPITFGSSPFGTGGGFGFGSSATPAGTVAATTTAPAAAPAAGVFGAFQGFGQPAASASLFGQASFGSPPPATNVFSFGTGSPPGSTVKTTSFSGPFVPFGSPTTVPFQHNTDPWKVHDPQTPPPNPFIHDHSKASHAFTLREFQGFGSSTPVLRVLLSPAHLAFQTAVKAGNVDHVRAVHADVGKDIDVNFRDPNNGRTFLHWAAFYGHESVAMFLIELGANKDIEGLGGATPLHLAAQEGRVAIVTLFLAKDADKDKTNDGGATALSLAARHGHLSAVQRLLDSGAEKNKINLITGDTPLHLAAERGHLDVVTCLIGHGAEKNVLNRLGKTPISRALRYSHVSLLEYFKTLELAVPVVSMRVHVSSGTSSGAFGNGSSSCRTTNIHSTPDGLQPETGELTNGDAVDVFVEPIGGFYKLVDGRGYALAAHFIDATIDTIHRGVLVCKCAHHRPDENFPLSPGIIHLPDCKWTCCSEPWNKDLCRKGSQESTPFSLGGIPPPLFCPNKHSLCLISRSARAMCDVCGNPTNKRGLMLSANWCCVRCDYDICDECARVTSPTT